MIVVELADLIRNSDENGGEKEKKAPSSLVTHAALRLPRCLMPNSRIPFRFVIALLLTAEWLAEAHRSRLKWAYLYLGE